MTAETVNRAIWFGMFCLGVFSGWQLCLLNERYKATLGYKASEKLRLGYKCASRSKNLAGRYVNALDIMKNGKIRGLHAYSIRKLGYSEVVVWMGRHDLILVIPDNPEQDPLLSLTKCQDDGQREKYERWAKVGSRKREDFDQTVKDIEQYFLAVYPS